MPTLSRFYGILIVINWREHNPPHFHALYGNSEVLILIEDLSVHRGSLPTRALQMVLEWARLHQDELRQNWLRAQRKESLVPIEPLP